ncbi:universal stress protein PHOS34-like [Quercus robur]|uniref:universal stress protein PHOS34-like n=1 Tax=Quercus robur TaxID=38942 RepID=UPI0021639EEA|nr:universal stress protein PHOS34-like [Quercus robur]
MASPAEAEAEAVAEKQVMVVAIDDSEHSTYALEWTLDHFFTPYASNHPFKLVLVHAKPTASSVVGLAGPGAAEVLPMVEADLKKIAARIIETAKGFCHSKSVHDVKVEVVEGDARNVLCEAVEKHHASILVVGSHGYGAIKRAVLGSVSDYCAHHAHCTVMIVKRPKIKH